MTEYYIPADEIPDADEIPWTDVVAAEYVETMDAIRFTTSKRIKRRDP